jgi:hypothetical protein
MCLAAHCKLRTDICSKLAHIFSDSNGTDRLIRPNNQRQYTRVSNSVVTLRGMTTRQQNVDASRLKRLAGGCHGWELTERKIIRRLS